MKKPDSWIGSVALLFVISSACTQPFDAEESESNTENVSQVSSSFAPGAAQAADWSGNVITGVFDCPFTGWNAQNTATCTVPPDWVLVGGAYQIDPGGSYEPGVLLTESYPVSPTFPVGQLGDTWSVSTRGHLFTHVHRLAVKAIGLKLVGLPAAQLRPQMRVFRQQGGTGSASEAIAQVPSDMFRVGGGAVAAFGGAGHLLTVSAPWFTDSWRAASKDHDQPDPTGRVFAYAIGIPRCPTGWGRCLSARVAGNGTTCGGGTCGISVSQTSMDWGLTSVGAAATYNGAGRLLTRFISVTQVHLDPRYIVSAFSKDHKWPDTGMQFAYLVEIQQVRPPPPG
jgi:hypothetical protein